MTKEDKKLVSEKIKEAYETLDEAAILLKEQKIRGAMNRIYYGLFYATNALLLTKGFESSKHSGVIGIFHREFVKTGVFPKETAKFLDIAFDMRIKGDYGTAFECSIKEIEELLERAVVFVKTAESICKELK